MFYIWWVYIWNSLPSRLPYVFLVIYMNQECLYFWKIVFSFKKAEIPGLQNVFCVSEQEQFTKSGEVDYKDERRSCIIQNIPMFQYYASKWNCVDVRDALICNSVMSIVSPRLASCAFCNCNGRRQYSQRRVLYDYFL